MKGVPLEARLAVKLLFVAFLLAPATANAELTAHGDLFVRFDGGIAPKALPRQTPAPIAVSVSGTIRTLSGVRPPALRQIEIAINRNGHLDTRGLPTCPAARIEATTTEQARALCAAALVGTGSFAARTAYPEQSAFPTRGRILAFNARVGGHAAILAHVYGTSPAPLARLITFQIRRTPGPYGILLTASLPAAVNRYGYVKRIALRLHRSFAYRGQTHSYLSAACAAPPGFPGATFPFARTSMSFADGRKLSSTLVRSCRVRG